MEYILTCSKGYTATLTVTQQLDYLNKASILNWSLSWSNTTYKNTKGTDKFIVYINNVSVANQTFKDLIFKDHEDNYTFSNIMSGSVTIPHDENGNHATVPIKLKYTNVATSTNRPSSKTGTVQQMTLVHIPNVASVGTDKKEYFFGTDFVEIDIVPDTDSLIHKLYYQASGGSKVLLATVPANTWVYDFVVPSSLLDLIPSSQSLSIKIFCETLVNNNVIGTRTTNITMYHNVNMYKPTLTNFLCDYSSQGVRELIIKGYTQLTFSVTATPQHKAGIESVWVSYQGTNYYGHVTKNTDGTYDCTVNITDPVDDECPEEFVQIRRVLFVKDTRGSCQTYIWTDVMYNYVVPELVDYTVERCLQDGTLDDVNGTYAKHTFSLSVSSLNELNRVSAKLQKLVGETWTDITDASWMNKTLTDISIVDSDYGLDDNTEVRLIFYDKLTEMAKVNVYRTIYISYTLINFGADGKSIALGMQSSNNGEFESAIPYVGQLGVKNPTIVTTDDDTVAKWKELGTGLFYYSNSEKLIEKPTPYGFLLNLVKGANVRQLWFSQSTGNLYHRGGNNSGWNGNGATTNLWRRCLDNTNVINSLTSDATTNPLSAYQGKVLKGLIDDLANTPREWTKIATVENKANADFTVSDFETIYSEILIVCRGSAGHVMASTVVPMSIYKTTTTTTTYIHRAYYSSSYYSGMHRLGENQFKVYNNYSGSSAEIYVK